MIAGGETVICAAPKEQAALKVVNLSGKKTPA